MSWFLFPTFMYLNRGNVVSFLGTRHLYWILTFVVRSASALRFLNNVCRILSGHKNKFSVDFNWKKLNTRNFYNMLIKASQKKNYLLSLDGTLQNNRLLLLHLFDDWSVPKQQKVVIINYYYLSNAEINTIRTSIDFKFFSILDDDLRCQVFFVKV
jgi:hypothetical protein